jgi:ubiquitin carboxyl-terminal hydrolase 10
MAQPQTPTKHTNVETSSVSELHDAISTQPTTPSPVTTVPKPVHTPRASVRAVIPAIPVAVRTPPQQRVNQPDSKSLHEAPAATEPPQNESTQLVELSADQKEQPEAPLPPKAPPKSWADLVRSNPQKSSIPNSTSDNMLPNTPGVGVTKSGSLADVIKAFQVDSDSHFTFLEPRGLVNTGNMCYMNSVGDSTPVELVFH